MSMAWFPNVRLSLPFLSDIQVEDLFKNASQIQQVLISNFSLPPDGVHVIFNSRVNFTEVCESPSVSPSKSSCDLSCHVFLVHFDFINYFQLYRIVFGLLPEDHQLLVSEFRSKRSLSDLFLKPPKEVAGGLIYKIIARNPRLLFDPEVRDVIEHLTGIKGSASDLDPVEVIDVAKVPSDYDYSKHESLSMYIFCIFSSAIWFFIQKVLLSSDGLQHLTCDNKELDKILIPPSPSDSATIVSLYLAFTFWIYLAEIYFRHLHQIWCISWLYMHYLLQSF